MSLPSNSNGYKKMFPFRLATTSYIYPDRIVPNVTRLAPFFDEIELVLFESGGVNNLPEASEIDGLLTLSALHEVGFNVHLPIDIFLGDEKEETRYQACSVIKKVIKRTLPLNPSLYTLHLDLRDETGQDHSDLGAWKGRIIQSIEDITELGIGQNRISIETLDYPFEWIEDIVDRFGFSICLDIGHVLIQGENLRFYLDRYLANTSIIHLHGHENGIDHLGIDRLPEPVLELIFSNLRDYNGIVSLEVFSTEDLKKSLKILEERWRKR
jgi:hypothetical protein